MVVQLYSAMWNQAVVMYQLLEWGLSVDRVLGFTGDGSKCLGQ